MVFLSTEEDHSQWSKHSASLLGLVYIIDLQLEIITCWGNIQLMVLGSFRELLQDSKCAGRGYRRPGYISESVSSVVVLFAQGHHTGTLHHSMYI